MLPRSLLLLALGLPVAAGAQCDSGLLFHSYQIPGQLGQYAIHDAPGELRNRQLRARRAGKGGDEAGD